MTSRPALFRREALEFQQHHRQWGEVVLLQPPSTKLLGWSLCAAFALVVAFLCWAPFARKAIVTGYLTPAAGTARIFAPTEGVVRQVHVKLGEQVRKGQPLLTIGTSQIAGNGEDVQAAILQTLSQQKRLLTQQIQAEQRRQNSERERLNTLLQGLATQAADLRGQIVMQAERIRLANSLVAQATELNGKGYMSLTDVKRRQADVLEQKQSLNSLMQRLSETQNQIAERRYSLEQLPAEIGEKIQLLRNELSDTEQRISETNGRRAYVIRAPMDGRVAILQAAVGQSADPHHLQMELVPNDSILQAELFVPARAIGFVRPGQAVRVQYDAFPYQHFGTYAGHVTTVSETMLTNSDVTSPVPLKEPAYKVIAVLERQDIDVHGRRVALQPDMLLKAAIILEKRPLIAWFLEPLLGMRM